MISQQLHEQAQIICLPNRDKSSIVLSDKNMLHSILKNVLFLFGIFETALKIQEYHFA